MRTVLVALAIGLCVISVHALGRRARALSLAGICLLLAAGALVLALDHVGVLAHGFTW